MKGSSILAKTGQAWKFKAASFFIILGGLAIAASRAMPRAPWNARLFVDLAGIAMAFLGGLVLPSLSIRCPSCRAKWFWRAISAKKHDEWFFWLLDAEACPECGFAGEPKRRAL